MFETKATSDSGELNNIDWANILRNLLVFDLPAYAATAINIYLAGNTLKQALLEPLPVFLLAFIDLAKKYCKEN